MVPDRPDLPDVLHIELWKKPYVGEPNKGKVKNYDGIFEKIENPEKEFTDRANAVAQGFQKYIKSYYYSAQVRFPIWKVVWHKTTGLGSGAATRGFRLNWVRYDLKTFELRCISGPFL